MASKTAKSPRAQGRKWHLLQQDSLTFTVYEHNKKAILTTEIEASGGQDSKVVVRLHISVCIYEAYVILFT